MMIRTALIGACIAAVAPLASAKAGNMDADAAVYVVHGIPGDALGLDRPLPVDIAVNETCALMGFTFGQIAGPVALPPGTYNISIAAANPDAPCSNDALLMTTVELMGSTSYSLVAQLMANGSPTIGAFVNDASATERGKARLIVFHTAAAPPVDVDVRREGPRSPGLTVENLANGNLAAAEVRPGEWNVSLYPAGGDMVVFGPVPVELQPFTAYLVFAIGSLDGGSFTLAVEAIPGLRPESGMKPGRAGHRPQDRGR